MGFWEFIEEKLSSSINVILLCVVESEGSSPGRKGFKMAVAADGTFAGTIGGGIMEHKLVEKARSLLKQDENKVSLVRQYHDKEHSSNQSGMICSGSQFNTFIPLSLKDLTTITNIAEQQDSFDHALQLSPAGLSVIQSKEHGLHYNSDADWVYTEILNQQTVIHIIGGGHVGLALSELMRYLGFYIRLYDDRPELNTIAVNSFANEKIIVDYEDMARHFVNIEKDYVVIMTIGYRTDKTVLKQLLHLPFFYVGLLGSDHKIKTLFDELKSEGFSAELLKKVHGPIGIDISSKTTKEIAVSIAAEVIREKNV